MDKNNIRKEYSNGDITIVWQAGLCIHSGNCVRNSPNVFQPKTQPWIKPEADSSEHIMQTIDKCPSGALSYIRKAPENYSNLVEALDALRAQGYTEDFNLKQNCLECRNGEYKIFHDEFHIDKSFRFDANTDPDDESILYAISSEKYQLKGVLVNGYGNSSEPLTDEMLDKLR
ncbi:MULTISPECIES: (4Fe-4S)-binding protein [unclassified Flavobacterium]|uniref:(4Fe-4S)-binding protein n=1 Tax=unclassified Flavobacterium TaxID=196869 RepID=UPI001F137C70|nr:MULTISPECIES: (4Fe-4S)-binding protein [unclassified Flavobacterium]UMY64586.1 (4Fe-4S)-binding protein [Flavobacterium sp. HJ-32-4]